MAKKRRTNPNDDRLRATYNKGSYKSLSHYLDAVYRKNKTRIDAAIPSGGKGQSSKTRFKQSVMEYMEEGKTANQAIDALERSRVFTSEKEHYERNVLKALKSDKDLYKGFRKAVGWKEKIDRRNLEYVESDDKYTLYRYKNSKGQIVYIRFGKSPTAGLGASIEVFV